MKKILLTISLTLAIAGVSFAQTAPKVAETKAPQAATASSEIAWEKTSHNFGNIPQNVPTTVEFKFKNKGKTPVIITDVKTSCGCTASDYSKEPVKPGAWGYVKATYNAAAIGPFSKTITVVTNATTQQQLLTISGTVDGPKTAPSLPNAN